MRAWTALAACVRIIFIGFRSLIDWICAAVGAIIVLFVLIQISMVGFIVYKLEPFYWQLKNDHLYIRQKINLKIDTHVPINSALNSTIEIPIKKKIAVSLPIQGKLELGIDEPFLIPVTGPIHVDLDHAFRIQKDLDIHTQLTLDQMVETRTLGFAKKIPIKAKVPVDLTLPFDEMIQINDRFSLKTVAPLTCQIQHDFNIPIDLTAKTEFLIDQIIPVPVNMDLHTGVHLSGALPCYLYLDIYFNEHNRLMMDHEIVVQ